MLLNHNQQGVGSAVVTGSWKDAVLEDAKLAGAAFPQGFEPGLIEVRIIAKGTDERSDSQG